MKYVNNTSGENVEQSGCVLVLVMFNEIEMITDKVDYFSSVLVD